MAFDFDYNERIKAKDNIERKIKLPQVSIKNIPQKSYILLNRKAIEILGTDTEYIKIGIDTETKKMVIIKVKESKRKLYYSKNKNSARINITRLIEENNIPSQTCLAKENTKYAKGGIIFDYTTE